MRRLLVLAAAAACVTTLAAWAAKPSAPAPEPVEEPAGAQSAVFAGGCFWCMEPPFEKLDGVLSVTSGYAGGTVRNPSYEEVSAGRTGHAEVVKVVFDPAKIAYAELLEVFWRNVDPTAKDRQFCDKGSQYRTAIFYAGDAQRAAALASKAALESSKPFAGEIVTEITALDTFWPAEEYHQDYYRKNPVRYRYYRSGCGRDRRLQELWGSAAAHRVGPLAP